VEPPKVVHLDELERIPGPGSLTWLPVRATLGLRAFGTNAYRAERVGDDVVEPHTESAALAHEELYFVAAGRATFTLDGEEHDAPAGAYVFIPDPATHRHAVAAEAGTTVLSFGGPAVFEPSAWEWYFRANAVAAEDPERAREILADGFRAHPESPGMRYALARLEARAGNRDAALDALRDAVARVPAIADEARQADDFAALRDDPAFEAALRSS
jgi:mannose-6-phosphate isomerase-like protein (cupin superfamily)